MMTSIHSGITEIIFDGRPTPEILSALKLNHFRWDNLLKKWWKKTGHGDADFLSWLDKKMNPNRPIGPCWDCENENGFFRNMGAAAPVLCEKCFSERKVKS